MMKNLFLLALAIIVVSCNDDNQRIYSVFDNSKVVVDRPVNNPWVSYNNRNFTHHIQNTVDAGSFVDAIGKTFKVNENGLTPSNLGIKIINISKFNTDNPGYLSVIRPGGSATEMATYADFSDYMSKSKWANKVYNDNNYTKGLFAYMANKKFTQIFPENQSGTVLNSVYGELNLLIKDSLYRISITENAINKLSNYLNPGFNDALFMNTPDQFISNYGGFVVSGIITGGKIEVNYGGSYKPNENKDAVESEMTKIIGESCGYYDGKEFGIGKKYSNVNTESKKINNIKISLRTLGGDDEYKDYTTPTNISNIDIGLNNWILSTKNDNLKTIIGFPDNGLIPITSFILEKNLKDAISKIYSTGVTSSTSITEPKISFELDNIINQQFYIATYLTTRFGDKILLTLSPQYYSSLGDYLKSEIAKWSGIMGVKIIAPTIAIDEKKNNDYNFQGFDSNNMKKLVTDKGVTYLVFDGPSGKFAYTIYNKTVTNDYGIENFINNLPESNLSVEKLKKEYTINAL